MSSATTPTSCSLLNSTPAELRKSEPLAPRPLRSLAARLEASAELHDPWCAYLPPRMRQQPELLASAIAAVPKLVFEKPTTRTNTSTSSSTSMGDAQSDASWDDASSVVGQVWELSQDPLGCYRIQEALEFAASEKDRRVLAQELHSHVLQAINCPHGNHVLQKCIDTMQPEYLQFIIDELTQQQGSVLQVATHRYGCRIVRRLLKACLPPQVSRIAKSLLEAASLLACHAYGNSTLQSMMEFGTKEQQYQVIRCVERNAASIGQSAFGGSIIEAAITHAGSEDKLWIARAVAQDSQVLLALAKTKTGHESALLVLEILPDRERQRACAGLAQHLNKLRASRFGRKVAAEVVIILGQGQ